MYTRLEYAGRDGMPAFVTVFSGEKDTLDLAVRGTYTNPQPENDNDRYYYSIRIGGIPPDMGITVNVGFRNNLLIYTLHHYPELCKHVKHMRVRTGYVSWIWRLEDQTNVLPFESFFKTYSPMIESVGLVSTGVAEAPGYLDTLSKGRLAAEARRDDNFHRFLTEASCRGRLRYLKYDEHSP